VSSIVRGNLGPLEMGGEKHFFVGKARGHLGSARGDDDGLDGPLNRGTPSASGALDLVQNYRWEKKSKEVSAWRRSNTG